MEAMPSMPKTVQSGQKVAVHDTELRPSARHASIRMTGCTGLKGVPGRMGRTLEPSGGGTGFLSMCRTRRSTAATK